MTKIAMERAKLIYVCHFLVYCLSFLLLGITIWTEKYFGKASIDKALSTLNFNTESIFAADSYLYSRFLTWCIKWPFMIAVCFIFVEIILIKKTNFFIRFFKCLPFICFLIGLYLFCNQYNMIDYLKNFSRPQKDEFALNYIDPNNVGISSQQKKSLVFIYVESLEETYSNPHLFGKDLLHNLNNLKKKYFSFPIFKQTIGASWTMGSLVATQCGIPLKIMTLFDGNRLGENLNHYLQNVSCLSDILASHGYTNLFINGASLKFAGKGTFLKSHHYDEVFGKEEWLQKGYAEKDIGGWGLSDDKLFFEAKRILTQLIENNKLFNLSILTLNTHGFSGKIDETCARKGVHDFPGIISCSANEVAEFVAFIIDKGWLKHVNIVIIGDHLAMKNPLSEQLSTIKNRNIFNLIISEEKISSASKTILHYDLFPTILSLQGFSIPGDKLALGQLAINKDNTKHAFYSRIKLLNKIARNNSEAYRKLWA